MKFSHTEENRDGRHLDVLTDEEDGLRIIVSRLGAELISMSRVNEAGEWIGFLYRDNDVTAPSEGWANHATVMGYYLHRLKNGSSLYRGHEIKGGTHGFLRTKTWHLAGSFTNESGASLKYQITPDDFSLIEYPLKVSVDLTYQIGADGVGVLFEFRNHEPESDRARVVRIASRFRRDFIRDFSSTNAARIIPTLFFTGQFLVGRNARG